MADQSDIAKALFEALPAVVGETTGWETAPVIDAWRLEVSPNEQEVAVAGQVTGSAKFRQGADMRTSALAAVDAGRRFVVTRNSVYRLGWPLRASIEPDADFVWPPVLGVASAADWHAAVGEALSMTGEHSISRKAVDALVAAMHDDGGWEERREDAKKIGEELSAGGRMPVAGAWFLLALDVAHVLDRRGGAELVDDAVREAERFHERDLTSGELSAKCGWMSLGVTRDDQVAKLQRIADPIAAAHAVAGRPAYRPEDDLHVSIDDGPDEAVGGVVVLKEIGGADGYSTTQIRKAFAPILLKRLPVTPAPDVAAARRALLAEFPYAQAQIDVLLSDLVGAPSARFRPTLLVSKQAGTGKSRLARRLGEISGLHVSRVDGAGAADNAIGGTPRRWSSGEASAPVLALLAARRADALIVVDEIEKAGTGRLNGSFADALLPMIESETAARYPDPFLQAQVDVSRISWIATANDELGLPGPLRDRFRILRIPVPTVEHLPALARGIVADLVKESASDPHWFPPLDEGELWIAGELWKGGSVRRLREIIGRILVHRADAERMH